MVYNITYDTTGKLVRKTARDRSTSSANKLLYSLEYGYDLNNNITRLANVTPSRSVLTKYSYGKDNLLTKLTLSTNKNVTYTYDGLNRLTNTSLSTQTPVTTAYTYCNSARSNSDTTYTTTKIDEETIGGVTYKYTYDKLGNITQIKQKNGDTYTQLYAYEYDRLNQLVREKDFASGKQYTYEYDNSGNILNKKEYNLSQDGNQATLSDTVSYGYSDTNWKDKLTSFDGQTITYDEIGNPLSYRDGMTLTWKNGRQLTTLTQGTNSISYKYDSNSVRTSKTVNGVKYTYEYLSGMLLSETRGDARFYYEYDANGTLYAVTYIASSSATPVTYYYLHNSRGDIESIYNSNGELVASYKYDSWGKVLSVKDANGNAITDQSHIANLNPFRYRSYYYDTETGLYYLMSRYYDPEIGRFINADGYISTGQGLLDTNMFAYCGNNPVNNVDTDGHFFFGAILKSIVRTVVKVIIVTTIVNHIANAVNHHKIKKELKESYTKQEAKREIKSIMTNYSSDCNVTFNEKSVKLTNSYKVNSRYDRQKISEILTRTNITNRKYDNISAEWNFHNVCYPISSLSSSAKDADLDYIKDERWYVNVATKMFEVLGWD